MESNEKEKIQQEKTPKKKGKRIFYWLIVLLGTAFIIAASVNIGMRIEEWNSSKTIKPKENLATENKEQKEVDEATLTQLKNIIGTKENSIVSQLLTGVEGKVNVAFSSENTNPTLLIFFYAKENNMVTHVSGTKYAYCADVSYTDAKGEEVIGGCDAIKISDFDKIASLYGITYDKNDVFAKEEIYGEYYLFPATGIGFTSFYELTNIKAVYSGDDIILTANVKYSYLDENETDKVKNFVNEYTFKLNKDKEYYLDSIAKK